MSDSGTTTAGIIVALTASVISNLGVNLQKLSFIYELRKAPEDRRPFYKNTRWWIGMIFVIISALMQFASFALAPQSIITPLGAFTLVVNLVMANRFLGEPLGKIDIIGTILICAGMAVAVVASGVRDVDRTVDDINELWIRFETLGYLAAVVVVVGGYMLVRYRAEKVLQDHIEKVGQLLIVEAHRLGVYGDDAEQREAEKAQDAARLPAESAMAMHEGNDSAVLATRSSQAWGEDDKTPPQDTPALPKDDGPIKHSETAPAAATTNSPLSPEPRTRAQGKSVPNGAEALGGGGEAHPTALAFGLQKAAANVKHETTRDAAPSYKAPDLTVFLKGTDTATQAALNAVGKRQKAKRSSGAMSEGATPASAAGNGSSPALAVEGGSGGSSPSSSPLTGDGAPGTLAAASPDGAGDDQDDEDEQIEFVDLEAVSELIGAPPVGYDTYATLHPLAYAGLAGVIGAQNTLFAKAVGEALTATIEGDNQFTNGFTYLYLAGLVTSIVFQQHFLAAGLQLFDALYIVPVFQAHFIVFGVLSGGLFYDEFSQYDTLAAILFPIGIVIGLSGVLLLTNRKRGSDAAHQPLPAGEEEAAKLADGTGEQPPGVFDGAQATSALRRGSTLPVGVESYTAAMAGEEVTPTNSATSPLQRSNSAEVGTGIGGGGADAAQPTLSIPDMPRRQRLASEGALELGSHRDVAAARAAAAQSFADFISSKAATPSARRGRPEPDGMRRGSSFLRTNWVESMLDRRADQQRVYSFMQSGGGTGEVDTKRSPALAAQDSGVGGAAPAFSLPPAAPGGGAGGRRRAFSVALATRGAAAPGSVPAAAAPLQRGATAPLQDGVAPVPLPRANTGGGASPQAKGRSRAATHGNVLGGGFGRRRTSVLEQAIDGIGTISSAALAGLRSVGGAGDDAAPKSGANSDADADSDEEEEELNDQYARAFGFDSVMEMRPHLEEDARPVSAPVASPPQTGLGGPLQEGDVETGGVGAAADATGTQSLQASPQVKGRRMTLGDRFARGVAGVSQFFLAEQATAALTSGTYAGRQGAVTFLDSTPALPLNEDEERAPSSAPGRARVLSEEAINEDTETQPPMTRLGTSVDVPAAIEEGDGASDDTPSAASPEPSQ